MSIAIRAYHLSKRYRLGAKQQGYRTLRETVVGAVQRVGHAAMFRRHREPQEERRHIWALDDVSFEVPHGETWGIVGRNGSGKTTLLKLLSRIAEPTGGSAEIYGRVGSLLEVGTGFHPELTGRENVYLSGAILGMRKAETNRRFDEIVAFGEVEKFIDSPVKHYSTGMHMRLAFAVAAHLMAEIMLVDEVLAVGDALFQKKCLGKMEDVAKQGRTVLFVSHNMGAVRSLCSHAIVLEEGRIIYRGEVAKALEEYFRSLGALAPAGGDGSPQRGCFGSVLLADRSDRQAVQGEPLELVTTLRVPAATSGFSIHCILEDMLGRRFLQVRETSTSLGCAVPADRTLRVRVAVPPLWLSAGLYTVHFKVKFWCASGGAVHQSDRFPVDVAGCSSVDNSLLCPRAEWSLEPIGEPG